MNFESKYSLCQREGVWIILNCSIQFFFDNNFRVRAPRYRMIPIETDLNTLPLLSSIPDKVLPLVATQSRTSAGSDC